MKSAELHGKPIAGFPARVARVMLLYRLNDGRSSVPRESEADERKYEGTDAAAMG